MTANVDPTFDHDLLARLRAETRDLHTALDAAAGDEITRSLASYARFLDASAMAVAALEPGIERQLGSSYRAERLALLHADRAHLDAPAPTIERPLLPFVVDDPATALGCAYVVEGSSLGGVVLADRVRRALGDDTPTAYLSFRGTGTAARWRWFVAELAAFARRASPAEHDRAALGARGAFGLYEHAFSR